MPDTAHVIAAHCITAIEGTREQEQHGDVPVLVESDSTANY